MCIMALANMTYNFYSQKVQKENSIDEINFNDNVEEAIVLGPKVYFKINEEILPFFETNWENLTSQQRRVKNSWHQTINKTLFKDTELFEQDPNDENAFSLRENDLLMIGPLHETVRMVIINFLNYF